MRRILDRTFAENLAQGAAVKASNEAKDHQAGLVLDDDKMTYWTTEERVESATIEFDFPEARTFDVAMLQEHVRVGQRIEEFSLEAWNGKEWTAFARGTTIGHKRLLRFPEVTSRKIRLVILKSRSHPTLSTFGLFKSPS